MNNTKTYILLFLFLWVSCGKVFSQEEIRNHFLHLTEEAKPWTFWYWMYGAVSQEGIKADLEAMKEVGLGGAYLMPIRDSSRWPHYPGAVDQLSPGWWERVRYSMEVADSLGLKLGLHISDGFALAGGPWITPKESMQKVVWRDTLVAGGEIKNLLLPRPEAYEGYYEDIALLALPVKEKNVELYARPASLPAYRISCGEVVAGMGTANGKGVSIAEDGTIRSSVPCWIQYEYPQPFTCRNVEIAPAGNNYQAQRLKVMVSDDGVHFRLVRQLVPARQGWQNTDANVTYALPPVTARYFRFYWDPAGSEPGSEDMDAAKWKPNLKIKKIILHTLPRLNQWEGKTGLVWRVAARTTAKEIAPEDCVRKEEVIDLTSKMKDGILSVRLPAGKWRLLRMGHTSTGHTNATGGGGKGLECDKFSEAAVKKQFEHWFGATFSKVDATLAHRVLRYIHVDSWECGSQNWSTCFPAEFKQRRGYDLRSYLPLLAGIPIDNVLESEKVLRDVRTTISELVADVFYKTLAKLSKEYGCELSAECVAPTMVSDGMLHYQLADRPMGEFWLNSPTHDKPNDMLDAVSGAHIYDKKIIQAEGFTELRGTWNETPAMLKTLLDRNYALGFNKLFFHVNVHNPYMNRKPGMTLDGIGLFFQRDQTWWKNGAKALVDYVTRCQTLLQYGRPVADIAVFTGEEIPRRAVLPERLVPSLPGLFGKKRVESERVRLANVGEPLCEQPVGVIHAANMVNPADWVNALHGYAYDSFNRDALLRLAKVENGSITLPGGAAYKVLVLPLPRPMCPDSLPLSPQVQAKVDRWQKAGVLIPRLPYEEGNFSAYGLEPDVLVPDDVAWTHRQGKEADIYFISNQLEKARSFTVSLRVSGREPELWNPLTGEILEAAHWKVVNSRTNLKVDLAANGSVFIVLPVKETSTRKVQKEKKGQEPVRLRYSKQKTISALQKKQELVSVKELGNAPWTVDFPLIGETVEKDSLFDWSRSGNKRIKYYSGTVTYRKNFEWKADAGGQVFLSLGKVCDVAAVWVNGQNCGTVWTAPYRVDITKALKRGTNQLCIEISNTWANAINGADQGKAPFEGIWTNAQYRMKEKTLLPAGLLGPVRLIETVWSRAAVLKSSN